MREDEISARGASGNSVHTVTRVIVMYLYHARNHMHTAVSNDEVRFSHTKCHDLILHYASVAKGMHRSASSVSEQQRGTVIDRWIAAVHAHSHAFIASTVCEAYTPMYEVYRAHLHTYSTCVMKCVR